MQLKTNFRVYTYFGTTNPNLRSILKPEVELMCFCACAVKKNHEKRHYNAVWRPNFPSLYVFRTRNPKLRSVLKPEVEFMVFLRMRINKINEKSAEDAFNVQF